MQPAPVSSGNPQLPPNIATLCQILQGCLTPQREISKAAEEELKKLEQTQGQAVNLLQIAAHGSLDLAIRQVAAISFKNLVSKGWGREEENGFIMNVDKEIIKNNLLMTLIQAPPLIRVQLGVCMRSIIYADYPERWPFLLKQIFDSVGSGDSSKLYGGLFALRMIARKFEFKSEEDRGPLMELVNNFFPHLIQIHQSLLSQETQTLETIEMSKLICKIFWSTTFMSIPPLLMQEEHFHAWMNSFRVLLAMPIPSNFANEARNIEHSWWKLQKRVVQIVNRHFNKYSIANKLKKEPEYPFALLFERHCTQSFLESTMQMLARLSGGYFIAPRVINLALQVLTRALPNRLTYNIMRPHFHQLMFAVLFPIACFQDEDAELWQEDPHEYVRKGYDMLEDLYSPKSQVIHFLIDMVTYKNPCKDNLAVLVNHLSSIMNQFVSLNGTRNVTVERQMDGALLILGSLSEKLKTTAPYKTGIEQMLQVHILPVLNHPVGHLRARAVWCIGMFADFKFQEGRGQGQIFSTLLAGVVSKFQDQELPVRVEASVSLRSFIEVIKDVEMLRTLLPQLLGEFLKLINEIENDDMITTLEAIVEKFGDEIAPFAYTICQHLVASFWKSMEGDEEDDGMGALAALGCLRALASILESVSSIPELYVELEGLMFPLMYRMISPEGIDVIEEVMEIISYFTYFSPRISPMMWRLWPMIIEAIQDWAVEFFESALVPLDNFISRGTEHFLTCKEPNYLQSAYDIVEKVFAMELDDEDMIAGPRLFECIMLSCKGKVNECIEPFIVLSMKKIANAQHKFFKDLLLQVVANALYYNPLLAVQVLQKHNLVASLFTLWFQMIWKSSKKGAATHFKRENDKKINIIGLSSLFLLDRTQIPQELNTGGQQIIRGIIKMCVDLKKLRDEKEEESEEEYESGTEDEQDFEDDEEEEEEEDTVKLKSSRMRDLKFAKDDEESEDDEDLDDYWDYWEEDDEVESPLDNTDAHIFFADALNLLRVNDESRFTTYTSTLDPDAQQQLHMIFAYAEERRQALNKAKSASA